MKMMRRIIWILAIVSVFLMCAQNIAAFEQVNQQQTQGGDSFKFFYSADMGNKWAAQQFKPTASSLTKAALKLKLDISKVMCMMGENNIDVEIRENYGTNQMDSDAFAHAYSFNICNIPPEFSWVTIPLTQDIPLDISKKYWILVNYMGTQLDVPAFEWEKATNDVKPDLTAKYSSGIQGDYDFTFKIIVNSVLPKHPKITKPVPLPFVPDKIPR